MKILMFSEKDAANISLGRIAYEFIEKGCSIRIFAPFYNDIILAYFPDSVPRFHIKDLNQSDIDWCDIIFCSTLDSIYLPIEVFKARKPIFTHNYLMNRQVNWGGDICFVPKREVVASDYDAYFSYAYVGIGEPKYDEKGSHSLKGNSNNILFIDSGHFPFSYKGKEELAKTLIHICNSYPDYQLIIKPRMLPGDKIVTHRNAIHIYDVIRKMCNGVIPKNLVMLKKNVDLMELINSACTVVCLYTTAFVGAVVAEKGLVILENYPSRDVYDIREKTFLRNRVNMIKSGALIDYREIDKFLPDGIKPNPTYINSLLDEKYSVAEKIVEVCTYMHERFYSKNRFPKLNNTIYKKYRDDFLEDYDMTWEKNISRRFYDYMVLKSLILIDFHVKAKLNISCVLDEINKTLNPDGLVDEEQFDYFLHNSTIIRDMCIINNRKQMLKDNIDAGILLNAYYHRGMHKEIEQFPLKNIAAYYLFRAFSIMEHEKNSDECKKYLIKYLKKSASRKYNIEISDMSDNKFKAYEMIITILEKNNEWKDVIFYNNHLKQLYFENYSVVMSDVPQNEIQRKRYDFIIETEKWINNHRNDMK